MSLPVSPLASGRLDPPDIALFYATPGAMMYFINGLQWQGYKRFDWSVVGESACADSWGRALKTGEPSLSLPCFAERRYGGVPDDEHGIHHWARRGIVGRAVLCDIGRWREQQGRPLRYDEPDPIEPDELAECLAAQGTESRTGDILLMRTGWTGWYEQLSPDRRAALAEVGALRTPGLRSGERLAEVEVASLDLEALREHPMRLLDEDQRAGAPEVQRVARVPAGRQFELLLELFRKKCAVCCMCSKGKRETGGKRPGAFLLSLQLPECGIVAVPTVVESVINCREID